MSNICFDSLKTVRCVSQKQHQHYYVTVCLRQCHSLGFDIVTVWLRESRHGYDSLTAE